MAMAWREAQPVTLVHFTLGKPPTACEGVCARSPLYKYARFCRWWNATHAAAASAIHAAASRRNLVQGAWRNKLSHASALERACTAACAPVDLREVDGDGADEPPLSPDSMEQGGRDLHGQRWWVGCEATVASENDQA